MPRTLLSGERTASTVSGYGRWLRVEVQNGSGTWKDLTTLLGTDYVVGGSFGAHRDQPVSAASFSIRRRNGSTSLSPLVVSSALNVDDLGYYAPLLEKGRLVRAFSATIPNGTTPVSSDWREGFTGRIDRVAWESDPIVIACSDLGAWLMDTQIKVEGVQYGTTPTGTALETVIQNIVNATPSGKGTPTLYTPTSPSYAVTSWAQGRTKVFDAIRSIALQSVGWDVRFRYDASHVSRLTLFNPQRGRTTVDATFGPTEYYGVRSLNTAIDNIRNSGLLPYTDASGVAHTVISPANPAADVSVQNNGERYFELPESDAITTASQAQTLLDIVVSDLNSAPIEHEYELPFVWFVQLYDRYTFSANGTHYDEDQTAVVAGYRHTFDGLGKARTTLQVTGKVVGAYAEWLRGIKQVRTSLQTFNQVLARVIASDATTVTVLVTATSATGTPTVQLVAVTGGASRLSGPLPGVASASGTQWVFTRGASGGGYGQAEFKAVLSGNVEDTDFATIPPQGDASTVYLSSRARVLASDATTVTVRYAVGDPTPSPTVTITYQAQGVAGVSPASGGTVTPASTFTEGAGTYIDYVITRPAFGAGTGRVTLTASASGRVPDADAVDVPAVERDTVTPALVVTPSAPTATTQFFTWSATNPATGAAVATVFRLFGTTANAGAYLADTDYPLAAGTQAITVDRPPFGTTAQAALRVTATITGGGTASVRSTILNQVKTSFGPSLVVYDTPGDPWTLFVTCPTGGIEYNVNGGAWSALGSSPISVARTAFNIAYNFRATLDGQTASGRVLVPALPASGGGGSTAPGFSSVQIAVYSYAADQIQADWVPVNAPAGATYTLTVYEQTAVSNPNVGSTTTISGLPASASPYVMTAVNDIDTGGSRTKQYRLTVTMESGATVVATSTLSVITLPSTT